MIGNHIIELDKVDSTNAWADHLLETSEPPDGTVIVAMEQFAGRGQAGNTWYSEPGKNLTISVVLYPQFLPADRQFLLNKVISLSVLDFVHGVLQDHRMAVRDRQPRAEIPRVSVKWPNDIYVGDKKAGGILIVHKIMGDRLKASVAGIGININQTVFPADLPNPVSLTQLTGKEYDLLESRAALCRCLDLRYLALSRFGPANLDEAYHRHLLGMGIWGKFLLQVKITEGMINGVDDLGRLLVENRSGSVNAYMHKEIEYLL
jgi:BirA family biotin operon repressor/biotin-[acetyl-CoA-carboxylase] ligase